MIAEGVCPLQFMYKKESENMHIRLITNFRKPFACLLVSASDLVGDAAVSVIGLSVAGCLAVVSYLCSCRIMKKKEL